MTLSLPCLPPPQPPSSLLPLLVTGIGAATFRGSPVLRFSGSCIRETWGKGLYTEGLNLGSSGSVREGGACDGLKFQLLCLRSLPLALCFFWRSAPDFAPYFSAVLGSAVGARGFGGVQKKGSCIQLKPLHCSLFRSTEL